MVFEFVVAVKKHHIRTIRRFDTSTPSLKSRHIPRLPNELNSLITLHRSLNDGGGFVRRTIVHDDYLDLIQGLSCSRSQRGFDRVLIVKDRNHYLYQWRERHRYLLSNTSDSQRCLKQPARSKPCYFVT